MQFCPICHSEIASSLRYPRAVCLACAAKARSADGRRLRFSNESFSGGFRAWYDDTQEEYFEHICFIDEVACWADEAHMGGIVIQISG